VALPLSGHLRAGQRTQFAVDEREQLVGRIGTTGMDLLQ